MMSAENQNLAPKIVAKLLAGRWASSWQDALASAIAAVLAWMLAHRLFGHPHPVFAAISAIVCLSPALPSHGKQAVGLMLGVATGIAVGEFSLFLPDALPLLRISVATFFAIVLAASFGLAAVVPIQAGVSAVLVLALGPASAGGTRMIDVAIGTIVGLIFSQILLTPDPVRVIDAAARDLLERLAASFSACVEALNGHDAKKAQAALRTFLAAHESLIALGAGIGSAQSAAKWSVRGRLAAHEVGEIAARYDRRAIRLFASSLLFEEAFANALRKNADPPPVSLSDRITCAATCCVCIADGGEAPEEDPLCIPSPPDADYIPSSWQSCLDHLKAVEEALASFQDVSAVTPITRAVPTDEDTRAPR
ncbi:FUSC family protein [Caballeronia sp. HLA56]